MILRVWHAGYDPFRSARSDSFILTQASGNMLVTCDPEVCKQIFERSSDFKTPVDTLFIYNIYGPTMGASEGEDWKRFRKVIMPYFNHDTNNMVVDETLKQTGELVQMWSNEGTPITDIKNEVSGRVTIGVIAKVFFGKSVSAKEYSSNRKRAPGQQTSFGEAIMDLNDWLGVIVMMRSIPRGLKKLLPKRITRLGDDPYAEWKRHMTELHTQVVQDLKNEDRQQKKFKTLLESIVFAEQQETDSDPQTPSLTQDEVFGNVFFLILAGYDTSSTASGFAMLLLALHPHYQKQLQEEIRTKLGQKGSFENWDLKTDLQPLLFGFLGAIVKETLRLYNPVEWIPRRALVDTSLTDRNGNPHYISKGTVCILDVAAAFRHPHYWQGAAQTEPDLPPPLQFDPTRWLGEGADQYRVAYFPSGGGQRLCPGRKLAEIMISGILARVFSEYSVELVLDAKEVKMGKEKGLGESWATEQARKRAVRSLYEAIGFNHGIYPAIHIPIRFVKQQL